MTQGREAWWPITARLSGQVLRPLRQRRTKSLRKGDSRPLSEVAGWVVDGVGAAILEGESPEADSSEGALLAEFILASSCVAWIVVISSWG